MTSENISSVHYKSLIHHSTDGTRVTNGNSLGYTYILQLWKYWNEVLCRAESQIEFVWFNETNHL